MKTFCLTIFLALNMLAFAQENSIQDSLVETEPWTWRNAPKFVKFSPFDVFSAIPTFGLDYEVKLRRKASFQAGLAYVPPFMQFLSGNGPSLYDRMGGYRVRLESRIYMPVKTNCYLSVGISFRHLIIRDVFAVGMEEVTSEFGQPEYAYFVKTSMLFHRFNTNFDLKYGVQREFMDRMVIDFYVGLSMRNINVQSSSKIPEGGALTERGGLWNLEDNFRMTYPVPIIGLKIGFAAPTWLGGKG